MYLSTLVSFTMYVWCICEQNSLHAVIAAWLKLGMKGSVERVKCKALPYGLDNAGVCGEGEV